MDIKEKLFRENYLFTKEDVLKSIELFIEHEKLNEEPRFSNEIVKNRIKLCKKFLAAVKKCKLPALSELWWFYEYQFLGNSMELNLCYANEIEVENDEISGMTATVEHTLIKVECDYLTVEQYASMLGIEPVTVRQWIRRGKLRHAKKVGRDWLIPDTEDKPRRGFTYVHYVVEGESKIESDEFPLLALCDSISIFQDQDNKRKFICYLKNYKTDFSSELELTRSEVERAYTGLSGRQFRRHPDIKPETSGHLIDQLDFTLKLIVVQCFSYHHKSVNLISLIVFSAITSRMDFFESRARIYVL